MSSIGSISGQEVLSQLRDMQSQAKNFNKQELQNSKDGKSSFFDLIKDGVEEVNNLQKNADKMAIDVASGKSQNLHETMLAATKAELGFNLMVQLRNKVLEAYQEVMRMPV